MKPERPLISVIVPAYNAEAFLAEAIESVRRQNYLPLEIIVVDDGSTDGTAEVARRFGDRIRYIRQENAGPAAARNAGLRLARGELIAFLDADDLWPEDKLKVQLAGLARDPSREAVIGRVQLQLLSISPGGERKYEDFDAPKLGFNLGSGLYRKSVFERLGDLNPSLEPSEDVDFFLRMWENEVPLVIIEPVVLYYRLHGDNLTREREKRDAFFVAALKKSMDRRRQGGSRVKPLSPLGGFFEREGGKGRVSGPRVSVIMAVKNGERYLAESIESLRAQTYPNYEILVVDGHSTDGTERIARSYPGVNYQRQEGQGVAQAYNQGVEAAAGELIAFLSHDDTWTPEKLARQVEYLDGHPEAEYVIGRVEYFLEPGCGLPAGFRPNLLEGDHLGRMPETLVARKSLFERIGGFNPELPLQEDVDWFARAKDAGAVMGVVQEVMVRKRVHDHNTSLSLDLESRNLLRVMRDSIRRQREEKNG